MSANLTRIYAYNTTSITLNATGSNITHTNVYPAYSGNNWISDLSTSSPDGRPDGAELLTAFTKQGSFTNDSVGVDIVQFSSGTNINVGTGFTVYASAGAQQSVLVYVGGVLKATLSAGQTYNGTGSQATGSIQLVPYSGTYPGYTNFPADSTNFMGYVKLTFQTYTSGSNLDNNTCHVYFVPRPIFSISTVSTKTLTYGSGAYSNSITDSNNQFVNQFVFSVETMTSGSQTFPVVILNGIGSLSFSTIYNNPYYDATDNTNIVAYIRTFCKGTLQSFTSAIGYTDNGTTFVPENSISTVAWGSTQSVNLTFSKTTFGTFTQTITYGLNKGLDGMNPGTVLLTMSAMVTNRLTESTNVINYGSANAQSVIDGDVSGGISWTRLGAINVSALFNVTASSGTVNLTNSTLYTLFANSAMVVISNTSGSSFNVQYLPTTVTSSTVTAANSSVTVTIANGYSRLFSKTVYKAQSGYGSDQWAVSPAVAN